jgi:uncharacterized repeat protein (TIGR01451 family)
VTALATLLTTAITAGAQSSELQPVEGVISLESEDRGAIKSNDVVRVVVQLSEDPLATYDGGVAGIPATSPSVTDRPLDADSQAARAYVEHLEAEQEDFKDTVAEVAPSAEIGQDFQVALNGVAMELTETDAARVAALPEVARIVPDRLVQPDTEVSPGFIDATTLWDQQGGQANAGEGVIVGILDTGIWPEHPSFADPSPVGGAYPAPHTVPGSNGFGSGGPRSTCDFGNTAANSNDAAFTCNNKLIGAYSFLDTYKAVEGLIPTEFDSARDSNGHGTHTSSTAAGNGGVAASLFDIDRGVISGIAPRAHVIMYRVCGLEGCFQSDSVRAVEQAILDNVDVINFSISGGNAPYSDAVSLAFLAAYEAGVLVSASAGNEGPGADTVGHREPWTMTVGASTTNRHFLSTVSLEAGGDTLALTGATITEGIDTPTEVVVAPDDDADAGTCNTPAAAGTYTGQIVICERGTTARVEKSFNVAQGGAAGLLLYNPVLQGLATDNHFIPTVHLENDAGAQLLQFMSDHSGETVLATFPDGTATEVQGDVMAAFSSRGGAGQSLGVSKPDVTAPGVQILAGHTPMPEGALGGPPGQLFQAIQGTSMSSPHNAGAAALVKASHPDWTPGQIKSALMTTALTEGVTKEDQTTPADIFDMGSGRIDLSDAGTASITFDETAANYLLLEGNLWDANYPSLYVPSMPGAITVERTLHNELNRGAHWRTSVEAPSDLDVSVPKNINLPGGGSRTFSISVDARDVPIGEVRTARITFSRGDEEHTFPITIVRRDPIVPGAKSCDPASIARRDTTTCTITVTNNSFEPAEVTVVDKLPGELRLVGDSVVGADANGNTVEFNGTLGPAEPPTPSVVDATGNTPAGYLPLSLFGIAPFSASDESIANFTVPPFVYAGETYTAIGVVSNGYAVVGGGTGEDVDFINQSLPDEAPPNNVLAPFWTDLNPASGGALRIGILTDGTNDWLILDWEAVPEFSDGTPSNFQIWIGVNGVEDISYTYGAVGEGDLGFLTVGAENAFGNRGANWYFDGEGSLPVTGTELRVVGVPGAAGETHTITFDAVGQRRGEYTNYVYVTSDQFAGTSIFSFSGEVTRN